MPKISDLKVGDRIRYYGHEATIINYTDIPATKRTSLGWDCYGPTGGPSFIWVKFIEPESSGRSITNGYDGLPRDREVDLISSAPSVPRSKPVYKNPFPADEMFVNSLLEE